MSSEDIVTLDDAIVYLMDMKKNNVSIQYEFNGVLLSSDNITWDDVYQKFYGMTKQQYDAVLTRKLLNNNKKV